MYPIRLLMPILAHPPLTPRQSAACPPSVQRLAPDLVPMRPCLASPVRYVAVMAAAVRRGGVRSDHTKST